jgi:hypothetical protein
MSSNRRTYRRNSPEAVAHVIAALLAHDGRLDWRELEFLDDVDTLQILGVEREMKIPLARSRAVYEPAALPA